MKGSSDLKRLHLKLMNYFKNNSSLLEQIEEWQKVLKLSLRKSFRKIRIKKKKFIPLRKDMLKLINERNELLNSEEPESKIQLDLLNNRISCLEAEDNHNQLISNCHSPTTTST